MSKIRVRHVKGTPEEMAYEAPAEIDFSKGIVIRGRAAWLKYLKDKRDYARLAPDVRKAFPDDDAVNKALRMVLRKKHAGSKQRISAHRKSA